MYDLINSFKIDNNCQNYKDNFTNPNSEQEKVTASTETCQAGNLKKKSNDLEMLNNNIKKCHLT